MRQLAAEQQAGMSSIVRTVARWVSPFIILYGLYILSVAHRTPGGAFESGVILACGFVLLLLAYGRESLPARVPVPLVSALVSAGALLFWAMAVAGLLSGDSFLSNIGAQDVPAGMRGTGLASLCELGFAIEVVSALVLLLVSLSVLRVKACGTDDDWVTNIEE